MSKIIKALYAHITKFMETIGFYRNIFCMFTITHICFIVFFFFDTSINQYKNKKDDISLLEFYNWKLYDIGEYINTEANGVIANRYEDKEVFNDFEIKRLAEKSNGSIEILRGIETIHQGDTYDFPLGVEYSNIPNIEFFSETGTYNVDTQIFIGKGDFRIKNSLSTTNGKDIFYDKKTDTIIANNINSQILNFSPKRDNKKKR